MPLALRLSLSLAPSHPLTNNFSPTLKIWTRAPRQLRVEEGFDVLVELCVRLRERAREKGEEMNERESEKDKTGHRRREKT